MKVYVAVCLFAACSAETDGGFGYLSPMMYPVPLNLDTNVPVSINARAPPQPPTTDLYIAATNPKGLSGYVPLSPPYSNPDDNTLVNFANDIPVASECTVRPQTIIEIEKVRKSAAQLAANIGIEGNNIVKRKAYIEQMSTYLNDRIRDLNKVKQELAEELRWVQMTNEQINLLNAREKQMKLQDIMSCMNSDQRTLTGKNQETEKMFEEIKKSSDAIQKSMQTAQKNIDSIQEGKEPEGGGDDGGKGKGGKKGKKGKK